MLLAESFLFSGHSSGHIAKWNLATRELKNVIETQKDNFFCTFKFDMSNQFLFYAGNHGKLLSFSVQDQEFKKNFEVEIFQSNLIDTIDIDSKNSFLYYMKLKNEIQCCEYPKMINQGKFQVKIDIIMFSLDLKNQTLIVITADNHLNYFDLASKQCLKVEKPKIYWCILNLYI